MVANQGVSIRPTLATKIIRSLRRGVTVSDGANWLHVGHEAWLKAQYDTLAEIAEDGGADTKFVRGSYGAGKSHFLTVLQQHAEETDWVTAHVQCEMEGVHVDRFETLYRKLIENIRFQWDETKDGDDDPDDRDYMAALLARYCRDVFKKARLKVGHEVRVFEAEARVKKVLQTYVSTKLPGEFRKALRVYVLAELDEDYEQQEQILDWLRAKGEKGVVQAKYLGKFSPGARPHTLKALKTGSTQDTMGGLLWLIHKVGFKGLVLCVDEVEELRQFNKKRRDQCFQALREHVDNTGKQGGGYQRLCLYLAATPVMFTNKEYFPRYEALQSRIQPVSEKFNPWDPIIDLDKTPLTPDQMEEVARKVRDIYQVAYPDLGADALDDIGLRALFEAVMADKTRFAKPRLLTRVVVSALEFIRVGDRTEDTTISPKDLVENVIQEMAQQQSPDH